MYETLFLFNWLYLTDLYSIAEPPYGRGGMRLQKDGYRGRFAIQSKSLTFSELITISIKDGINYVMNDGVT